MPRKKPIQGIVKPILTEDQVREIKLVFKRADKEKRKLGHKAIARGILPRLAKKYGVTKYAINHIRWNERWAWVKI